MLGLTILVNGNFHSGQMSDQLLKLLGVGNGTSLQRSYDVMSGRHDVRHILTHSYLTVARSYGKEADSQEGGVTCLELISAGVCEEVGPVC